KERSGIFLRSWKAPPGLSPRHNTEVTEGGRSPGEDGVSALQARPLRCRLPAPHLLQRVVRGLRGRAVRAHPHLLRQCLVLSTRIGLQPDSAAAARLSLPSRLLRSWYGASSRHGHRLLGPSLAVVSDERARLRGLDRVQSLRDLPTSQGASLPRLSAVHTTHGPSLSVVRGLVQPASLFPPFTSCSSVFISQTCLFFFFSLLILFCSHLRLLLIDFPIFVFRINNCVGELNQKYFIQFLFYTGLASLYSMLLVVSAWVWRIRNEREGDADKDAVESPSKHLIVAHYIILLVESVLFGVFVMVIFYDQLISIITDETPIEQMRNRLMIKDRGPSSSTSSPSSSSSQLPHHASHHTRKPKLALLREVFGRGSIFCWLLPLHSSPPSVGGVTYSALPDYDV
uniref:Palmitoyltransferase n=1 Tax=Scophthalmus maximus TaxID=52904 RepID=A0A8D3EAM5_SCOMX